MPRPPVRGAKVEGRAEIGRAEVKDAKIETTDEVLDLIGDGKASVSAGLGLGDNAGFGRHKFEAFSSCTLQCNGDLKTVRRAQKLVERLAEEHLTDLIDRAEKMAEASFRDRPLEG